MSPVEILLLVACALLLVVTAVATVTMRWVAQRAHRLEEAVDRLREQVEELARREAAREIAEAHGPPREADWLITSYDGDGEPPRTVTTPQVVGTTFGEPLIKVAAFSQGVRQALREERRAHLSYQVRREYRRRRRESRARARSSR